MKKLIMSAFCAVLSMAAFASGSYQIYKFQLNVKTTDAKGIVSSACGENDYCYREKRAVTIRGVLGGCGCGAINADGVCGNAILYMWDETHKIAITNVEMITPWTIQRVGKTAKVVEHFASFRATYGENDRYSFEVTLGGFGTYAPGKTDPDTSYVTRIDGNFAGVASAPIYVKKGTCSACYSEPDAEFVTTAFSPCVACADNETIGEHTPFFGVYVLKYDAANSKTATKNGLSKKVLSLPSFVGLGDYVGTNIGD